MRAEQTGLKTTLYQYGFKEEAQFIADYKCLAEIGDVEEVFIDNGLAFEYTRHRIIDTDPNPDPAPSSATITVPHLHNSRADKT